MKYIINNIHNVTILELVNFQYLLKIENLILNIINYTPFFSRIFFLNTDYIPPISKYSYLVIKSYFFKRLLNKYNPL